MRLPEITEVQRVTLKPGDRVVVRVPGSLTQGQAFKIGQRVREALGIPDEDPVLVLPDGITLEVADGP